MLQVAHRIHWSPVHADFKVKVRSGRIARRAFISDGLTFGNPLAYRYRQGRHVSVQSDQVMPVAAAVVNHYRFAIAALPTGPDDSTAVCGMHRAPVRAANVDSGMHDD